MSNEVVNLKLSAEYRSQVIEGMTELWRINFPSGVLGEASKVRWARKVRVSIVKIVVRHHRFRLRWVKATCSEGLENPEPIITTTESADEEEKEDSGSILAQEEDVSYMLRHD